jgi:transposase-like protein
MATSLTTARRALRSLGDRGRTTRIPEEIRTVLLAYADEGRAGGESWAAIAQNVGLSVTVLQRWRRQGEERHPSKLRPVVVREEDLARPAAGLILVTAHGEKLEGLGVEDAIRLVKALR